MKMLNEEKSFSSVSRRNFLKGATAIGAAAALSGCGSDGDTEYIQTPMPGEPTPGPTEELTYIYGSSTHNCGGRCVSRAVVSNGRILRILTKDSNMTGNGEYFSSTDRNLPQTRPCSKCRSYRYRVHHPGRLSYPMKQTKRRGDLTGFQRISWKQALDEIAMKHKVVTDTYGLDGIYVLYDSAANAGVNGRDATEAAFRFMGYAGGVEAGGHWKDQFGTYSTHQNNYMQGGFTGINNQSNANDIANNCNTLVFWGENCCTTYNNTASAIPTVAAEMKARGGKIYFIGPEMSDTGIVSADEWLASKPFTDVALIAGMVYHMLDNTFNLTTGAPLPNKTDRWLDIDWLDTMVYGFFDSPAYSLTESTGVIGAPTTGTREIWAVKPGMSYCSWILGSNSAAQTYSATDTNYTARQFNSIDSTFKRWAPCSYTVTKGSATVYPTKKDFTTAKTPAWASAITGVPEQAIKDLAERFCKNGPVSSFWSGGMQKQADGCQNLFGLQALQVITKNCAEYGAAYGRMSGGFSSQSGIIGALPAIDNFNIAKDAPLAPQRPTMSCTAWHTSIKATFIEEMYDNGYRAKYIPNWPTDGSGNRIFTKGVAYWDDGGTKAGAVQWKRTPGTDKNGKARMMVDKYTDDTGKEFYDWVGRTGADGTAQAHDGTPVYSGVRLMYNGASNIVINQHENSNDSMEMMYYLNPIDEAGYKDAYKNPDLFCLVTFDNFMSPTTRYSDYVLPTSTAWEHPNVLAAQHTEPFFIPAAVNPPGESKPAWELCKEFLKAYEKVMPGAASHGAGSVGVAASYAGGNMANTIESLVKDKYFTGPYVANNGPFKDVSWEDYVKDPVLLKKPDAQATVAPTGYAVKQKYNNLTDLQKLDPFIMTGTTITTYEHNTGGYNQGLQAADNYADLHNNIGDAPLSSLRYHVCSHILTWQYENRFNKWHGFLPADQRGQHNTDFEGDKLVLPIPLYYAYQDYFIEAFGNSVAEVEKTPFLLTTTHDKYRSHSSMAENPMLRELSHRVPGLDAKGKAKQGNDYGDYAMGPTQDYASTGTWPYLSRTIEEDGSVKPENKEIASYTEIWMNPDDAAAMTPAVKDGDLVQVENPIGAVRCVAHLSYRCVRGFVGLHQGCWYDPRPIPNGGGGIYGHDYVDVGGNCNTLMASQPSRIDHGNGQQSAMVRIFKVEQ